MYAVNHVVARQETSENEDGTTEVTRVWKFGSRSTGIGSELLTFGKRPKRAARNALGGIQAFKLPPIYTRSGRTAILKVMGAVVRVHKLPLEI